MNIVKFILHGGAWLIGMGGLFIGIYALAGALRIAEWIWDCKHEGESK